MLRRVRLLGSGAIFLEVLTAADLLRDDWDVDVDVWSVTSFSELARETQAVERSNMLHPRDSARTSHVERCLAGDEVTVAATDYVGAYPRPIVPLVRGDFVTLGTDGFGRSDTRAELRRFFDVDRHAVVVAALHQLSLHGAIDVAMVREAITRYGIDVDATPAWER